MNVVLVTGTSSGIGRESVHHLAEAGCKVIATARNLADIEDLASEQVDILPLDVSDEKSMVTAVDEVVRRYGRIDGLVNNAGYGTMLPVEETPMNVMRAQFDVNVFGLHRLTQLVLPHMRQQGSGRIVNVSSIAGHVSVPMMGSYCATKHAVRALTIALDAEIKPHGLHASLIEPGVIKTKFGQRSQAERHQHSNVHESAYKPLHDKWENMRMTQGGAHPKVIAKRIVHACTAKRPKLHYFAPWDAKSANILKRLAPDAAINWGMRTYFWK